MDFIRKNIRVSGTALLIGLIVVLALICAGKAVVETLGSVLIKDDPIAHMSAQRQAALAEAGINKSAQCKYDDTTEALANILESSKWADSTGALLEIGRGYFVCESEQESYVAGKFILGESSGMKKSKDSKQGTIIMAPVEGSSGPSTLVLTELDDQITVECSLFPKTMYTRLGLAEEISVERPDDSVVELLGGQSAYENLAQQVAERAWRTSPGCSYVSLKKQVTVDWDKQNVKLSYKTDNDSGNTITVLAGFGLKSIEIS